MSKYNKLIFLVSGIIIFLVRLTGDMFLYSLDLSKGASALYWYYITTVAIFVSFGLYYFYTLSSNEEKKFADSSGDTFLNSMYQNFVLSLIIVLLVIFFSFKDTSALFKRSYVGLILSDFFFIYTVIVTLLNFQFTYKWLWQRRHRLTKFYMTFIGFIIVIILINETSLLFSPWSFKTWLNVVSIVAFSLLVILTFLINKKTSWIANLPRPQKTKFFWILILNVIIAIKILMETQDNESLVFGAFNTIYPLTLPLLSLSFLFYGIYLFRLFMSLLAVMPSSVIVERKSSELNSLAYLNKIVAESANNSRSVLIDTVTNLAIQASSAYGAWTEIYEDDSVLINTCVNVKPTDVTELHNKHRLNVYFQTFTQSHLVESVREIKELSHLLQLIPNAKSLIIVPLYTSTKREGTLIVFDSEDFAMEQDDLNILTAFGDNVRIALENSRLVSESIEKERYRNEMMLARTMQQKLLPQKLPVLQDYTIAAYSIPAAEVGGDYYDVVKLKSGDTCILIGDVSGKGISAAFYMAQLKGVVLSEALESENVSELLCKINLVLYKNIESQMFITMSAITINPDKSHISMARAGHMPFLLKHLDTVDEIIPRGIGIGLAGKKVFDINIEQIDIELKSGDCLIMFTDGLNEVRDKNGNEFGLDKLIEFVECIESTDANDYVNKIRNKIDTFAGDVQHHDDMTFIAISKI
jgi:serine phosphatase RsbU (regulator of sigma subunit)